MIITTDKYSVNVEYDSRRRKSCIIFVHGFSGSSKDFLNFFPQVHSEFHCAAIDLPGHGKTESPEEVEFYSEESIHYCIDSLINHLACDQIILCGYSMGGRAVLSYSIMHPDKISGLILESALPGIEAAHERNERITSDEKLAENIERNGINWFVDYWLSIPLFKTYKNLSKEKRIELKTEKKSNNVVGLANSLRGFSAGKMKNLWSNISKITFPALLISGELDSKFTEINSRMNAIIPHSKHAVVKEAGHNTHLEKPEDFIILVNNFLNKIS